MSRTSGPNYAKYVEEYKAREKILRSKGYEMYDTLLPERTFYELYQGEYNQRKEEIKRGQRKSIGNIRRQLISDQAYEVTYRQAQALKTAAKVTGQHISELEIRKGGFDWTDIRRDQYKLRSEGKSKSEIHDIIAHDYFGSP